MRHPNPRSHVPACAAVVLATLLTPSFAASQSNTPEGVTKPAIAVPPVPRTADGKPDLSGVYTNASVIPLERPKDLGSKEFFTPEEADAFLGSPPRPRLD